LLLHFHIAGGDPLANGRCEYVSNRGLAGPRQNGHMCRLLITILAPVLLPAADVSGLSWMAGCWEMTRGPLRIEEHWSKPAGGTMLGFSRTIKAEGSAFSEFMQIVASGAKVVYVARVGAAGGGTPFTLVSMSETEVTFENAAHDFPQRILYRRDGDRGLYARIEGTDRGKARFEEFPMVRAKCE
jgi:hypothetical protein